MARAEKVVMSHPFLPYDDPVVIDRRSFQAVWEGRGWQLVEPDTEPENEEKEEDESWLAEQDSSSAFGF